MDNNNLGPSSLKSIDRRLPSVGGSVVEDPEDPLGGAVRFLIHNIMGKVVKEDNPRFGLTAPEQFRPPDVPGGHVIQCTLPLISKFHPLPFPRSRSKGLMSLMSGLNAGLFIGGEGISQISFCSAMVFSWSVLMKSTPFLTKGLEARRL